MIAVESLPFSPLAFVTLVLMLAGSIAAFVEIIRRSTTGRSRVEFAEWGRERRFRIQSPKTLMVPPPFSRLEDLDLTPIFGIASGTTILLQLRTRANEPAPGLGERLQDVAGAAIPSGSRLWHVLVRRIGDEWPPTALRPTNALASIIDLFDLPPHMSFGDPQRYLTHGVDAHAARQLAESFARSLLPPDTGILLDGHRMVIDFSERRFDTIELTRMISLANQVAEHLPARA